VIVTAKDIRLLWWSMFWRYFLYAQVGYFLVGIATATFRDFAHDATLHDLMLQHNVVSDGIQGAIEALASGVALAQALRIHLPRIFGQGSPS